MTAPSRATTNKRRRQGTTEGTISRRLVSARKRYACDSGIAQDCQRTILPDGYYWRHYGRAFASDPAYVQRLCCACDAWHQRVTRATTH